MDKQTIGNSKAAVNLIKKLQTSEYSPYSHTIMSSLSKYFSSTAQIMYIPNTTIREAVLIMWCHRCQHILADKDIPEVLKTHALCVVTTRFRQLRKKRI